MYPKARALDQTGPVQFLALPWGFSSLWLLNGDDKNELSSGSHRESVSSSMQSTCPIISFPPPSSCSTFSLWAG